MLKKLNLAFIKGKRWYWPDKIEDKDNQFLIEKNIGTVKKTIHTWLVRKKTPEIMLEIEKNYRLYRRVY